MKNRFLLLTIFFINSSICGQNELYKWIYTSSMPLVFGHLAVQAKVELARQSKNLNNQNSVDLKIVDVEKEKPSLNFTKNDIKQVSNNVKTTNPNQRSVTSQYLKATYLTFLTYAAFINLANAIYERNPGSWTEITAKPFVNAALIYCADGVMHKKYIHEMLFS